jgi:hypothetical protein
MLGSDARIVQAGADRVRFLDLAALVTQDVALRAMENSDPAGGEGRRVTVALDAVSSGLDAVEPHARVGEEAAKEPDGVRPSAHARDCRVGQGRGAVEKLPASLLPDDALEAGDQLRVRVRSGRATDAVVRRLHVRDPVAKRLVHRVLQGA